MNFKMYDKSHGKNKKRTKDIIRNFTKNLNLV